MPTPGKKRKLQLIKTRPPDDIPKDKRIFELSYKINRYPSLPSIKKTTRGIPDPSNFYSDLTKTKTAVLPKIGPEKRKHSIPEEPLSLWKKCEDRKRFLSCDCPRNFVNVQRKVIRHNHEKNKLKSVYLKYESPRHSFVNELYKSVCKKPTFGGKIMPPTPTPPPTPFPLPQLENVKQERNKKLKTKVLQKDQPKTLKERLSTEHNDIKKRMNTAFKYVHTSNCCNCLFCYFYSSTKSWRGYIFTTNCVSLWQ